MRIGVKHPQINLTGLFTIRVEPDGRQDFGILIEDQGVRPSVMHLIWDERDWERVKNDGVSFLRSRTRRPDEDAEIADLLLRQPFIGNP